MRPHADMGDQQIRRVTEASHVTGGRPMITTTHPNPTASCQPRGSPKPPDRTGALSLAKAAGWPGHPMSVLPISIQTLSQLYEDHIRQPSTLARRDQAHSCEPLELVKPLEVHVKPLEVLLASLRKCKRNQWRRPLPTIEARLTWKYIAFLTRNR